MLPDDIYNTTGKIWPPSEVTSIQENLPESLSAKWTSIPGHTEYAIGYEDTRPVIEINLTHPVVPYGMEVRVNGADLAQVLAAVNTIIETYPQETGEEKEKDVEKCDGAE